MSCESCFPGSRWWQTGPNKAAPGEAALARPSKTRCARPTQSSCAPPTTASISAPPGRSAFCWQGPREIVTTGTIPAPPWFNLAWWAFRTFTFFPRGDEHGAAPPAARRSAAEGRTADGDAQGSRAAPLGASIASLTAQPRGDPIATRRIEDLMQELKNNYTIAIVTHNLQRAKRVSDMTAFLYVDTTQGGRTGYLVEYGPTQELLDAPKEQRTKEYVSGEFS